MPTKLPRRPPNPGDTPPKRKTFDKYKSLWDYDECSIAALLSKLDKKADEVFIALDPRAYDAQMVFRWEEFESDEDLEKRTDAYYRKKHKYEEWYAEHGAAYEAKQKAKAQKAAAAELKRAERVRAHAIKKAKALGLDIPS